MDHSLERPVNHIAQPEGAVHWVSHSICLVRMFHLAELELAARLTLSVALPVVALPRSRYM